MKEPVTGCWTRTIGQGLCQYAGVNEVRDAFMEDKMMKVLPLPHRINRPSHILRQSMCVAYLVLRPVVSLEKDIHEGA